MTRFTIEILPEAEAEFREAFLWYFERSPMFTDALRTEVLTKIDELQEDADSWPKDEDGIHFRILPKRFKVHDPLRADRHRSYCARRSAATSRAGVLDRS